MGTVIHNNQVVNVTSEKDVLDLLRESLDYSLFTLIEEMIDSSSRIEKIERDKLDSDFRSYEMQVESQHTLLQDTADSISNILDTTLLTQRLNKQNLIKELIEVRNSITNNI